MIEYILPALAFGLIAGLKPGPLTIIIVQQTLSRGLPSGVGASLAPLITDGPIILAAILLFSSFKDIVPFVAIISVCGAAYLMWLAVKIFGIQALPDPRNASPQKSLWLAVKVNFLNPNPYLFWFTVGGSYILHGTVAEAVVFVATAIGTLVLTKMGVAVLAAYLKPLLGSSAYLLVMKALAVCLIGFAITLFIKAFMLLT